MAYGGNVLGDGGIGWQGPPPFLDEEECDSRDDEVALDDDDERDGSNYGELMSTETHDLLQEMQRAYGKKIGRTRPRRGTTTRNRRRVTPSHAKNRYDVQEILIDDESADESVVEEDFYDDPNDTDYAPSTSALRRTNTPRKIGNAKRGIESMDAAFQNEIIDVDDDDDDNDEKDSTTNDVHKPVSIRRTELAWSDDEEMTTGEPARRRKPCQLPPAAESLLGQANVSFAQGRSEEALKMVEEVVRLHPGCYESYDLLSVFHGMLGDKRRQLHFGLLAAHLNKTCSAEKWAELAEAAAETGEVDRAIHCYTKAHRAKPGKWEYYEPKIHLLEKSLETAAADDTDRAIRESILKQIADTKLAALKGLLRNVYAVTTDDYVGFARSIFQQFYENNDIRRAISCLKCLLERIQSDGRDVAYEYLNDLVHVAMHFRDYEDALLAIFRYSNLQAFNNLGPVNLREDQFSERIEPHRRLRPITDKENGKLIITHYNVPEGFPVDLMAKTIACWIRLKRFDACQSLLTMLMSEVSVASSPDAYWEISEALADGSLYAEAEPLLDQIVHTPEYEHSAPAWLCYAEVLSARANLESASLAFERVVQLSPYHVGARLSLSALQQQLGQTEEAIQTLDIGDGRLLEVERLDERLLYQRCLLQRQKKSWKQFLTTARYLMAIYFKDAYSPNAWLIASGLKWGKWKLTLPFRSVVLDTIKNTNWERLVQRMKRPDASANHPEEIWDIFFQMCEVMFERRMITDLFYVCCFASQCPIFLRGCNLRTVLTLLLLAALMQRHAKLAWGTLRHCAAIEDSVVFWNVYGAVYAFSQEIRYHKFTLRAMLRMPDCLPLAWLSGNNSLIAGTYQHALAEYFYILQRRPDDPLLNLLIGVCFIHLAARRFTARRHDLFIQGLAFLSKYEDLRGPCQEVYYNIGRAFQQAGVLYAGIHYYERALAMDVPILTTTTTTTRTTDSNSSSMKVGEQPVLVEQQQQHRGVGEGIYDLRPLIAHNLALIYQHSDNTLMARELLERYCTVE